MDARPWGAPDAARPRLGTAVPLLGTIAAGAPIMAEEHVEEILNLPTELVGRGVLFALRVRGDSMIEAASATGR